MSLFPLKPTSSYVKAYYAALAQFERHDHTTEGNTRSAFATLLERCTKPYDWHLVQEKAFRGTGKQALRADGALVDSLTLVHGLWEAKDTADHLEAEIKKKVAAGYPLTNILFQSPSRAILYQDNRIALDCDLTNAENLMEILQLFFDHRQPHEVDWEEAVFKFAEKIPELAEGVTEILNKEYKKNADFRERFKAFEELCKQSINPNLTEPAIQKMLVQHLLTERVFRKVFNNNEFLQRNVIAAEIEKVIRSITDKHFSRDTFLKPLDRFYTAIEKAAEVQTGYTEKQHFLNAVYEKFFQSFDKNQADTHGIVYTPQPIVDFMVRSVEEVLKTEFGKSLSDEGVHILDPFTGTGNFITRIMQSIKKSRLPQKYANELHCNEVMLLPYYIASMNIEHAYSEALDEYQAFTGICLVDTFTTVGQLAVFSTENTTRIHKQMEAKIKIVIGNPPYNASQAKEDDKAKNRVYLGKNSIDDRVRKTYTKDSVATLRNKHGDPYIKAFRWATDRLDESGIVCFVTNNSFVHKGIFDGMRKHLAQDYSSLYIIDLGGDVKANPKLSGTTHNVFGIQLGVSISLLVKRLEKDRNASGDIFYSRMPEVWRKGQKYQQLDKWESVSAVPWAKIAPSAKFAWLHADEQQDFSRLLPLADKKHRLSLFHDYSLGISTNRDGTVYSFRSREVSEKVRLFGRAYNSELARFQAEGHVEDIDDFLDGDLLQWSRNLKRHLTDGDRFLYQDSAVSMTVYRPFVKKSLYNADITVDEPARTGRWAALPSNRLICVPTIGGRSSPWVFVTEAAVNLNLVSIDATQVFPFFILDKETGRVDENITDWALAQYRTHYADKKITKWDIFHSTYSLLHHPEYRTRYAANLKRELPRIPFPPDLHAFAKAGKRLMELHIDYEKQPEYPLEEIETPKVPWTLRVERMRLSKDKTELRYNEALTLRGIPPAAFDYRLGNRSALEWVIDQYQVSTDTRSGIVNDPNRQPTPQDPDAERYILRLIGQVITVSLETQKIIAALPSLNLGTN